MKYRLVLIPAFEVSREEIVFNYETAEQMTVSRDSIATLLLYLQDDIGVMEDYSNAFSCEQLNHGEWTDFIEF